VSSKVKLTVDGSPVLVKPGTTVAAAILHRQASCRISVTGSLRGPVCGMGICFECRATVDGRSQQKTCQTICKPGMVVQTDGR
jgi:D-hydroxyproline dehydrogenase subunit gamma